MTHKDFVLIAGAVAAAREMSHAARHDIGAAGAFDDVSNQLADALAATNPRFDRQRFLAAARGEPSTGRDRPR